MEDKYEINIETNSTGTIKQMTSKEILEYLKQNKIKKIIIKKVEKDSAS